MYDSSPSNSGVITSSPGKNQIQIFKKKKRFFMDGTDGFMLGKPTAGVTLHAFVSKLAQMAATVVAQAVRPVDASSIGSAGL